MASDRLSRIATATSGDSGRTLCPQPTGFHPYARSNAINHSLAFGGLMSTDDHMLFATLVQNDTTVHSHALRSSRRIAIKESVQVLWYWCDAALYRHGAKGPTDFIDTPVAHTIRNGLNFLHEVAGIRIMPSVEPDGPTPAGSRDHGRNANSYEDEDESEEDEEEDGNDSSCTLDGDNNDDFDVSDDEGRERAHRRRKKQKRKQKKRRKKDKERRQKSARKKKGGSGNNNDDDTPNIMFPEYNDEHGLPTTEVLMEAVYADDEESIFLGWRWCFIAHAPGYFWGNAIQEQLRVNAKRFAKLSGKQKATLPMHKSHHRITSAQMLGELMSVYLGQPERQHEIIAALYDTRKTMVHTDNVANPTLRVFTLENASTNLKRFRLDNIARFNMNYPIDTLPRASQRAYNAYLCIDPTLKLAALAFPHPELIWRTTQASWNIERFRSTFFPDYSDDLMRLLATALRDGRVSARPNKDGAYDAESTLGMLEKLTLEDNDTEGDIHCHIIYDDEHHDEFAKTIMRDFNVINAVPTTRDKQLARENELLELRHANKEPHDAFTNANITFPQLQKERGAFTACVTSQFEKCIFVPNHPRLSKADAAIVNWFLDYREKCERTREPFYMDKLNTYDSSLSPESDWMAQRILRHEVLGISTTHVVIELITTAQYDAFRYAIDLHMNVVMTGKHQAGKSHVQMYIQEGQIPGVGTDTTHETAKAFMVAESTDSQIAIYQELPSHFINGTADSGEKTGDATLKARMTSPLICVAYFARDESTGERQRKIIYASHINASISATNELWSNMPPAVRSRFMKIPIPEIPREGDEPYKKNVCIGTNEKQEYIRTRTHQRRQLEMFLVWLVNRLIMVYRFSEVDMTEFQVVMQNYYAKMDARGVKTSSGRNRKRVELVARTFAIQFAIHYCCFSESAMLNVDHTFSLADFAHWIEPMLVVSHELTNFAIEMCIGQFIDPLQSPIVKVFKSMCSLTPVSDNLAAQYQNTGSTTGLGRNVSDPMNVEMGVVTATAVEGTSRAGDAATVAAAVRSDRSIPYGHRRRSSFSSFANEGAAARMSQVGMQNRMHTTTTTTTPRRTQSTPASAHTRDTNRMVLQRVHTQSIVQYRRIPIPIDEGGGERKDYNYIEIMGSLHDVASSLGLACKDVKPSDVDVIYTLQQMAKTEILTEPRNAPHQLQFAVDKERFRQVIINDTQQPYSVCLSVAFVEMVDDNILSDILDNYTHPYLDTFCTVSINPISRFPFALPLRKIKKCTHEFYADNKGALTFKNRNAICDESIRGIGMSVNRENETGLTQLRHFFNLPTMTFGDDPETTVIKRYLATCGIDPKNAAVAYAFPSERRRRTRIYWRAHNLLAMHADGALVDSQDSDDDNNAMGDTQEDIARALDVAEEEDAHERIKPDVIYPMKLMNSAYVDIFVHYEQSLQQRNCDRKTLKREKENYRKSYTETIARLLKGNFMSAEELEPYVIDEDDGVAVAALIEQHIKHVNATDMLAMLERAPTPEPARSQIESHARKRKRIRSNAGGTAGFDGNDDFDDFDEYDDGADERESTKRQRVTLSATLRDGHARLMQKQQTKAFSDLQSILYAKKASTQSAQGTQSTSRNEERVQYGFEDVTDAFYSSRSPLPSSAATTTANRQRMEVETTASGTEDDDTRSPIGFVSANNDEVGKKAGKGFFSQFGRMDMPHFKKRLL